MANNFPPVNEIFDELDKFRDFCAYAYVKGHPGYVFDERDLFNESSYVWRAYLNRHKGPPKRRERTFKPGDRKPYNNDRKPYNNGERKPYNNR
jgi:hypothetical protein